MAVTALGARNPRRHPVDDDRRFESHIHLTPRDEYVRHATRRRREILKAECLVRRSRAATYPVDSTTSRKITTRRWRSDDESSFDRTLTRAAPRRRHAAAPRTARYDASQTKHPAKSPAPLHDEFASDLQIQPVAKSINPELPVPRRRRPSRASRRRLAPSRKARPVRDLLGARPASGLPQSSMTSPARWRLVS